MNPALKRISHCRMSQNKNSAAAAGSAEGSGTSKVFKSSDLHKEMLFTYMKGHYKVLYGNLSPSLSKATKIAAQTKVLEYSKE